MLQKFLVAISFIAMVVVNAMANILPINGVSTGEVSDSYANLFAPAGLTFSIWGLIYLLLAIYTVYQFGFFRKEQVEVRKPLLKSVNTLFIITSVLNIAWIFAWHYNLITLTLVLMVGLLVSLIRIATILAREKLVGLDEFLVAVPFSVYFGWITVATIANITIWLVSVGWQGFGLPDQVWTVVILLVGASIGLWRMLKDKSIAYGLVFAWAYAGIFIKHYTVSGFAGQYPAPMLTAAVGALTFLAVSAYLVYGRQVPIRV
jgi:hypothetical protein